MFFVFIDTAHKNWASRSGGKGSLMWGKGSVKGEGCAICVHRRYLFCGRKGPKRTVHPQKIPFLWTEAAKENSASTKDTLFVDKRHLREQLLHKRHPFCGRKRPKRTVHPQKIPFLWTKGISENNSSTKDTLFVDGSGQREQCIHKRRPFCGRKGPKRTVHPQKIPYSWTKGIYENNSSTKDTFFVDGSGR